MKSFLLFLQVTLYSFVMFGSFLLFMALPFTEFVLIENSPVQNGVVIACIVLVMAFHIRYGTRVMDHFDRKLNELYLQ